MSAGSSVGKEIDWRRHADQPVTSILESSTKFSAPHTPDRTIPARSAALHSADSRGSEGSGDLPNVRGPCPRTAAVEQAVVRSGVPGASARREHERRRAKREANVRAKHPRIGGLILALQPDPQSTTAWATGAEGKEKFGARLNAVVSDHVRVLHDRRIPTGGPGYTCSPTADTCHPRSVPTRSTPSLGSSSANDSVDLSDGPTQSLSLTTARRL